MKKEDPRITRTKEIIHQAFITTLEKQDYDDITVQDILDNAKINRSTFYKHYLNKDHLATDIIEKLKNKSLIPLLEERFSTLLWNLQSKQPLLLIHFATHYRPYGKLIPTVLA